MLGFRILFGCVEVCILSCMLDLAYGLWIVRCTVFSEWLFCKGNVAVDKVAVL